MVHFVLHALVSIWRQRIALFWPIWIATTAIGVILVIWVMPPRESTPPEEVPSYRQDWSRTSIFALAFLCLFLACYVAACMVWEDFAYYDNSMFTNGTLAGHNIPLQVSPESGRFFPLGHQEFSLLRHVTHTVTGYH